MTCSLNSISNCRSNAKRAKAVVRFLVHDVSNYEACHMALLKECEVRRCAAAINIAPLLGCYALATDLRSSRFELTNLNSEIFDLKSTSLSKRVQMIFSSHVDVPIS